MSTRQPGLVFIMMREIHVIYSQYIHWCCQRFFILQQTFQRTRLSEQTNLCFQIQRLSHRCIHQLVSSPFQFKQLTRLGVRLFDWNDEHTLFSLFQAAKDASGLLFTLRSDEPSSKVIFYLQKQIDAMKQEVGHTYPTLLQDSIGLYRRYHGAISQIPHIRRKHDSYLVFIFINAKMSTTDPSLGNRS